MLKIVYSYNNVSEVCKHFARNLNLSVRNSFLTPQPENSNGSIYHLKLPNDLQLLCINFTPKEDVMFQSKFSGKESYFFRIDGIFNNETKKSSVFFGSMKREAFFVANANKRYNNISILLSKEWLNRYFEDEQIADLLQKIIFGKRGLYHYEFFDSEYKRLTNELMQPQADTSFELFIIQNRVMLILERFFSRLYTGFIEKKLFIKASAEQLERLQMVEALLIKDVSFPAPTITKLAKVSALSTTKLKSLFKEVYGMPIHLYFQKHRMQKAKAMLLSKKNSVRETASELGYINLKDFIKAFQRTFGQLPEEIAVKK